MTNRNKTAVVAALAVLLAVLLGLPASAHHRQAHKKPPRPTTTTTVVTTTTAPTTTTTGAPGQTPASWSNVAPGTTDYPQITITVNVPNGAGVSFFYNGVFNRTDPTGPPGSVYEMYPAFALSSGDVLRATWTDQGGTARFNEHVVGGGTTTTTSSTTTSTTAPTTTTTTGGTTTTTIPPQPSAGVCTSRVNGGVPVDKFPGAACTGVPAGTTLTSHPGGLLTQDGAVYDSVNFQSGVCVAADNVTFIRSRVNGVINVANPFGNQGCGVAGGAQNFTAIDVEVNAQSPSTTAIEGGVYRPGISCLRCDIHHAGAGINGGLYSLVDTYVHDLIGVGDAHVDGIQGGGAGGDIEVRHSNIDAHFGGPPPPGGGFSCAICFYADNDFWGMMDNILVQDTRIRLVDGGVYCVYAAGESTNTRFIGNTFVRNPDSGTCGSGGPYTSRIQNTGDVWSGNHFDDGEPIP